ncbi:MAG TPA: hypothetical protein VNI01_14230, partial [Elusimicrobiota bacterium]|nr:hypothetical protein [Elusimicrobiota bacterium]
MNARAVSGLQAALRALLLALAFLLPLALHFRFFDPARAKDVLLLGGASCAAALLLLRWLEAGRMEIPAGRLAPAAAAAVLLAWSARSPGGAPWLAASARCAELALFLAALVDAASASFSADLADAALAAGGLAALGTVLGLGPSSTLGHPDAAGAYLGALFPLAFARALDPEAGAPRRALAWTASLLLPAGVWAAGSSAGAWALTAATLPWSTAVFLRGRDSRARHWAIAALGAAGALALALDPRAGTAPPLGSAGSALPALALCVWGAARAFAGSDGDRGLLDVALASAAAGLLAAPGGGVLAAPATGAAFWLFLGAASAGADRGARVWALPIPLAPAPRRALCAVVAAGLLAALS